MNIQDIKQLVSQQEIFSIDIRYPTVDSIWQGFSYPASDFDFNMLESDIKIKDIIISNIDISSYFIDPFLAHKTIVFLGKLKPITATEREKSGSITNNNTMADVHEIGFHIDTTSQEKEDGYLMPPKDKYRDIRTEIVMALAEINVKVVYHYYDGKQNSHVIAVPKCLNKLHCGEILSKVKYACTMVSRAYNVEKSIRF